MSLRFVTGLVVAAGVVAACSAAPNASETVGIQSSAVLCESVGGCGGGGGGGPIVHLPPPPKTQAQICAAYAADYAVGCVVAPPTATAWQDAHDNTYKADVGDDPATGAVSVATWLKKLEAAGCTPPARFDIPTKWFSGMWVQTCPRSVLTQVTLPQTMPGIKLYKNIEIACNACMPLAADGFIQIGWSDPGFNPAGCRAGECQTAPFADDGDAGSSDSF
jgi:hypothetical protein